MELWLKRIWLTNGILLLIAFAIATVQFLPTLLPDSEFRDGPIVKRDESLKRDSLVTQDIRFTTPTQVGLSDFFYIQIFVKDLETPIPEAFKTAKGYERSINFMFAKQDGSEPRLLLDRKAFIADWYIPLKRDTLRKFNIFHITFDDSNGDGRLNHDDDSQLYVSNLDGRNLTPVLPDNLHWSTYSFSPKEDKIYIVAKQKSADPTIPIEQWPESIYVLDIKTQVLKPYLANDQPLQSAKRILWQ